MIEVFTPRDSGPTAIDPHSLSNTVYINKSRGTPSPMFQYPPLSYARYRPQSNPAGGDVSLAIVICHFHRIESVMECVNFDIIMVASTTDNYFSFISTLVIYNRLQS